MRIEHEKAECLLLVEYLTLRGIKFSHIPQETFTKSWAVKMKNKQMGVMRGIPDYMILIPAKKTDDNITKLLFIEMKKEGKGGIVSKEQASWLEELNKVPLVEAAVCRGFNEAKKFIEKFIYVGK